MKKRLVYQVLLGEVKPLWRTCVESIAVYCQRHGIEHRLQTEPILKIVPPNSKRSANALRLGYLPIYEKFNALPLLADYNAVASVDADVWAAPFAPDIFEALPADADYGAVVERSMPITRQYAHKLHGYTTGQYGDPMFPFRNCGVEVMRPGLLRQLHGQSPSEFIHRPEFAPYVNGEGHFRWQTEQTLKNVWVYGNREIRAVDLDWKWNALFGAVPVERAREAHFVHFFLSDHLTGSDPVEMLRTGTGRARV